MSILEEAQQRILTRLAELESNRREYDELLAAAGKLGLDYNPDAAAANGNGPAPRARSRSSKAARSKRAQGKRRIAPAGQRRQQTLDLVNASPEGLTVKQVADKLGVDPTSLFRVQKQLVADGLVRKDGPRMLPAPAAS